MELNPKSMIAKVEAAGTDKGIALTPGSMIGNRKVNAEELSARGAKRKAIIDEARAKRQAEFIAKAMGQANARMGKNPPTAEQYDTLALIRRNILSILPQELVGLCTHNLPTDEMALDGTNPVLMAFLKPNDTAGGEVGTYWGLASPLNEDYAFKIKATYDKDTDKFVGKVLGGSAMALGGNVTLFDDLEFDDAEEGDYVYLVYENVDSSFNEVGSWGATIEIGDDTAIGGYNAPQNLVFVIGQISSTYIKNVRQDHKGAIVMPAISNVVDIQTQLP